MKTIEQMWVEFHERVGDPENCNPEMKEAFRGIFYAGAAQMLAEVVRLEKDEFHAAVDGWSAEVRQCRPKPPL